MTVALRELLRIPIMFMAADGSRVDSPMINADVAGIETLLVLDTGSDAQILTRELADSIGLVLKDGEDGTDHAGVAVPSWSAGNVPMRAGDLDLTLRDVVVIPAPAPFSGWGVGGILSPQHLDPGSRVVIDLIRGELLVVTGGHGAIRKWLAERQPDFTMLDLERDGKSGVPVVQAAIAGFPAIATLLNTGTRETEFDVTAVPDLSADAAQRLGGAVSGTDVIGSMIDGQILVVGGAEIPVPALAVRTETVYPHGMVGMDLLHGTVVCCDADPSGRVLWQVPSGT